MNEKEKNGLWIDIVIPVIALIILGIPEPMGASGLISYAKGLATNTFVVIFQSVVIGCFFVLVLAQRKSNI
jgi:hypothetical protein